MKAKHNVNYFKRSGLFSTMGAVMLAGGVLLLMFGHGALSYILATVCVPVGLVLFLVASSGRSTETDMDDTITEQMEGFHPLDESNDPHFERKAKVVLPVEVAEGYEYREGVLLRRAKSGVLRSSEFTRALIHVYPDRLRILTRTVSLVSEYVQNGDVEIPFATLTSMAILPEEVKLTVGRATVIPKSHRLTFRYGEGKTFSTPIDDSVEKDEFVAHLERVLQDYRKEN